MKFDRHEIFRTVATLGAALLLAGWLRFEIQGELLRFSKWLMIAGAVLLVVGLALNYRSLLDYFSRRSAKLGANALLLGLGVLAILALLNYLGYRHHKRFDLTLEKLYTLSDQTKRVVGPLKQDVDVIQFAKTPDPRLREVAEEYSNLNHHLHYRVVDPQEHPELAKKYEVARMGQVVVAAGQKTERVGGEFGATVGEQDLTPAILKVTSGGTKTICFIEGHGEKSITETGPHGLSEVAAELKKENYETKSVNLVRENSVPSDCSGVVEAGPTTAFFSQETEILKKYLDEDGKALILVDPDTDPKMDEIFQDWNIDVGKNIVIDASGVGRLFGIGPAAPLVMDYGTSPITRNFENTMTFFYLARTVSIADRAKSQPDDVELLKTSARSFTKPEIPKSGEVRFDAKTDKAGPLSLGVAGEKKAGAGDAAKDARVVVIGDSDFASNQWQGLQRNGDLFLNAINWLSEEENLISIRPKQATNRRLTVTESQQRGLLICSLFLLPAIVVFTGGYIWWKRR